MPETAPPIAEPPKDSKDLLKTPPEEAKELEALIAQGHQAHNRVGFLTFLGILVLALTLWYFKSDNLPFDKVDRSYPEHLQHLVKNYVEEDLKAQEGGKRERAVPRYPQQLYAKLRTDIYFVSGIGLLLAVLFVYMEKAKTTRNHLLVYRALAREIEKLRLRLKEAEGGRKKKGGEGESAGSETPPAAPGA